MRKYLALLLASCSTWQPIVTPTPTIDLRAEE